MSDKITISFECDLDDAALLMALYDLRDIKKDAFAVSTEDNYFWLVDIVLDHFLTMARVAKTCDKELTWFQVKLLELVKELKNKMPPKL